MVTAELKFTVVASSVVFAQLSRVSVPVTQTDTPTTLRATSVATGRICALRSGDAA